jgi:hypothetical protein
MAACAAAIAILALSTVRAHSSSGPQIDGCPVFPDSSPWNQRVDQLPVASDSARIVSRIGARDPLHPDFGSGRWHGGLIGLPYNVVTSRTPKVPVTFSDADYSDPGPYPLPRDAEVESAARDADGTTIVVDRSACKLYELYQGRRVAGSARWRATAGATWDLRSNDLRPDGWTSADAAGLPIFPGLVRHDEVADGSIDHALRLVVPRTRKAWIYPARHASSNTRDPSLPAMGQRLRLKSSVDLQSFPPQARVIVRALQRYGVLVSNNGAPWFLSGAPDPDWDMSQVFTLSRLHGSDFEVVDTGRKATPAPW